MSHINKSKDVNTFERWALDNTSIIDITNKLLNHPLNAKVVIETTKKINGRDIMFYMNDYEIVEQIDFNGDTYVIIRGK